MNEEQLPDIPDEAGIAETGGRISEEMLMAFVAELPDGCRTVFNLYVFEEKSHKEIAEILHIKEHSSTSQLHRAKCLLIKELKNILNMRENDEITGLFRSRLAGAEMTVRRTSGRVAT